MVASKRKLLAYTMCICLICSCSTDTVDEINEDIYSAQARSMKIGNLGNDLISQMASDAILIAPSGDITGVTDAANITEAMNTVKSSGGTVYLTDQNNGSTDHFYVSSNIVIDGFNGTVTGEGKEKTLIHAGRQSAAVGFTPAYSPIWTYIYPWSPLASAVFQLDFSVGDVAIKNLSILVRDDQPTDIFKDAYNNDGSYIWTIIEIVGGEHNTIIENVHLEGKESSAYGNLSGFNAGWGIHVMPWANPPSVEFPPRPTKGNMVIKNVSVENVANNALLFMAFTDGSEIDIKNVYASNVGYGIVARNISDSWVNISNMHVSNHSAGWATGMIFSDINSGLRINENQFSNAKWFASLFLWNVHHARITNNTFSDISSFGTAVGLSGASSWNTVFQNDFRESGLPGWSTETPGGPGAVWLRGDTHHNEVFEMKFPGGNGTSFCNMIMDLGDNTVKNWEMCEKPNLNVHSGLGESSAMADYDRHMKFKE